MRGYLVSDQFERRYASLVDVEDIGVVWPRDAAPVAAAAAEEAQRAERASARAVSDDAGQLIARPSAADGVHERVAAVLDERYPSRFQAVRYECLDAAGHYFLRYAVPGAFGDVSDDELQRYGGVLPAHYAAMDQMLGRVMAALRPGDLLLVVSGFGMQPMSVGKRLLERTVGNPEPSGTHESAPDAGGSRSLRITGRRQNPFASYALRRLFTNSRPTRVSFSVRAAQTNAITGRMLGHRSRSFISGLRFLPEQGRSDGTVFPQQFCGRTLCFKSMVPGGPGPELDHAARQLPH